MTQSPGTDALPVAPIARRVGAYVIDAAIVWAILLVGGIASTATAASAGSAVAAVGASLLGLGVTSVVALAWFFVYSALQGAGGSVGMRALRLRLVHADSGTPLGFGRALLRNVVFGLSTAIVVGCFTPLMDGSGRSQGWHDRAAGALMLDARPAAALPVPEPVEGSSLSPLSVPEPVEGPSPLPVPGPVEAPSYAPTGHTLPTAPGSYDAPVIALDDEFDPHDATVLSAVAHAAQTTHEDENAMITVVPGISPSVPAPAPTPASGPESVVPAWTAVDPAPVARPAEEDDDLEETRISIPGHRLLFVWDDGARATVSGRTLFGRNPAPEPGAAVVVVRDETLSLSKTHFEAGAEASGGWVMDRHSTNGTTVVRDGVRIACPAGERVRIRLGDAIEIGDRIVTIGGYA
ncbi:RDD family protein [Microbacterium sp. ASV81]|uniref:RDD family protein n=1 Tax=Microbacterium capsulatum TaxID=3041921 RepID=A0ABU0XJG3_9MICO|nr:RDD family protein [Microbacterium sp. ASV81]MDQ4215241.1 RDD family protein [Microbacterium sp. ASV81]